MADHSFVTSTSSQPSSDDGNYMTSVDTDIDEQETRRASPSVIRPDKRRQIEAMQEERALNDWLKEVFDDE
ncbi:MAG: PA3496 family putative envelope integrity protein [Pontibacterium sp.]